MKTKKQAEAVKTLLEANFKGILDEFTVVVERSHEYTDLPTDWQVVISTDSNGWVDKQLDFIYKIIVGGVWIYSKHDCKYILC
jgi:hypothetical protein